MRTIVSSPSDEKHLTEGARHASAEQCVPVKLAFGHLAELAGTCDYYYLPRAVRLAKGGFLCPKMIGFSELVRHELGIDRRRILDVEWDLHTGSHARHFLGVALRLCANPLRIARAVRAGVRAARSIDARRDRPLPAGPRLKVGVLGHPYNVHDPAANMGLLAELKKRGAMPVTESERPPRYVPGMFDAYPAGLFWSFGREILAVARRLFEPGAVSGVIYATPFGCGLDSILVSLVEREARAAGTPFLALSVDEHAGRAAFITRLEAFLDILESKKNNLH